MENSNYSDFLETKSEIYEQNSMESKNHSEKSVENSSSGKCDGKKSCEFQQTSEQKLPAAKIPNEVEMEKRICEFKTLNIDAISTDLGMKKSKFIPLCFAQKIQHKQKALHDFDGEMNLFPLEWFADRPGDCLDWRQWIQMQKLCGKAFLPVDSRNNFEWRDVKMLECNERSSKWLVQDSRNEKIYRVSRVYLLLFNENPREYFQQISKAINLRDASEEILKFNAILNEISLEELPEPPWNAQLKILLNKTTRHDWIEMFRQEFQHSYKRDFLKMELEHLKKENPSYFNYIPFLEPATNCATNRPVKPKNSRFPELKSFLRLSWLYCAREIFSLMYIIEQDCQEIQKIQLFPIKPGKNQTFGEFIVSSRHIFTQSLNFLRDIWTRNTIKKIKGYLKRLGKGWFDLDINNWELYRMSKLSRLMLLIKMKMQTALRNLVELSTAAFADYFNEAFDGKPEILENFEWSENLIDSPYQVEHPIIQFDLIFSEVKKGFDYSLDILEAQTELNKMFENVVLLLHTIDQLEPIVLKNLIFPKGTKLSSTGLLDPKIVNQQNRLNKCLTNSSILLNAYLEKYKKYQDLKLLDISDYIKGIKSENKSTQEVKAEISFQLGKIVELENSLPDSIVIGPFFVDSSTLKLNLINKRKEMFNKLLAFLCDGFQDKISNINEQYEEIYKKLDEKILSIEHIHAIGSWMEEIPKKVHDLDSMARKISMEYEVLDYFQYPLPNKLFKSKWECLAYPKKIKLKQLETSETFPLRTEKFKRQQVNDEAELIKTIETISNNVEIYLESDDLLEMSDLSKKMDELWKSIVDAMKKANLLNSRQIYFEGEKIELEEFELLKQRLEPFKLFWNKAHEFTESVEKWHSLMLLELKVDKIEKVVQDCKGVFENLMIILESSKIHEGVKKMLDNIHYFESYIPIIKILTNPLWTPQHWAELIEVSGMSLKYSAHLTFHQLLAKGILKHEYPINSIYQDALEAERIKQQELQQKLLEEQLEQEKRERRLARDDI